jgi:hypothetical protein
MAAADYLAGVRADADYVGLTGTPRPTPWDTCLSEAMVASGRAVYEESVSGPLIGDLGKSGRG